MVDKCLRVEGPDGELGKAIKSFAPGYDPKMLYILLDKKKSARFFERSDDGRHSVNPGIGTVID